MDRLSPHLVDVIAQLRQGLRELYGDRFRDLLLYGSYARGDAREGSDVDLLLLLEGSVDTWREILFIEPVVHPLCLEHTLLLAVMPVSFDKYQMGQTAFLRNVQREAVRVETPQPTT